MNITNWANIPKAQNQLATGAFQTGSRSASNAISTKIGDPDCAKLVHLDLSDRKGYREDYSIQDAAESLWKQETQTFNLKDLNDPTKSGDILENMRRQARWDLGIHTGETKEEVLSAYIQNLRQNGLSGDINWEGLSRELDAFKTTSPEELADGLDYLASRYTATLDKLERNYQGQELVDQLTKLDEVYQTGKEGMIDGYTQLLQDNLGVSNSTAQEIKDSFSAILSEKVNTYQKALKQVHETIEQTGADSVWLKNHDAYVASQLRAASTAGQSEARYSVRDLTATGKIAEEYRSEIVGASSCGRNEATLALNLSMADMKAETMIQKGLISQNMTALLRNSRAQGHENALAALDRALSQRENSRAPGEPKGTFAPVDRAVFQGIYDAALNAYRQNGGDGVGAIRAGASYGRTVTAQASVKNANALRWGVNIESYWKNFYTDPDDKELSSLAKRINKLLIQAGQSVDHGCSSYQQYVNSWQNFISSIGEEVNIRA